MKYLADLINLPSLKPLLFLMGTLFFLTSQGEHLAAQNSTANPNFTPFSQFYFQQSITNPAYVGNSYQPQYFVSSRFSNEQYGKGKAFNTLLQWKLDRIPIDWGITMSYDDYDDRREPTNVSSTLRDYIQFTGGLQASFDFDIGEKGEGRVGLTGAMLYYKNINATAATSTTNQRNWVPSVDMGVLMTYGNFQMGISMLNANEPNFDYSFTSSQNPNPVGNPVGGTNGLSTFRRTGYITMSYDWILTETFYLQPHFMLRQSSSNRTVSSPTGGGFNFNGTSMETALILNYYDFLLGGFSYKFNDPNYFGSIVTAIRFSGAYQLSLSWNLKKKNVSADFRQFEVGIGAFLFGWDEE